MFLFILLLALIIQKVAEDITATVRKQTPPRHEYRMEKLKKRKESGGWTPKSSPGRYLTGLWDDAWDSAHHKRQLMADTRKLKREAKAARKAKKEADKQAEKNREAGVSNDAIGFDVEAPEAAELDPAHDGWKEPPLDVKAPEPPDLDSGAPVPHPGRPGSRGTVPPSAGATRPIGFDVTAPEAADLDSEAPVPRPGRPGSRGTVPPLPVATPRPASSGPRSTSAADDRGGAAGSPYVPLPSLPDPPPMPPVDQLLGLSDTPGSQSGVPRSWDARVVGAATRELATSLTERAEQYASGADLAGADTEAVHPLTPAQAATVEAHEKAVREGGIVPTRDIMALPVSVRADLLDEIRKSNGTTTVVPGYEDVEALAVLNKRLGGKLDPADIYTHPANAPAWAQAEMARCQESIAAAKAAEAEKANKAGADTAGSGAAEPGAAEAKDAQAAPSGPVPTPSEGSGGAGPRSGGRFPVRVGPPQTMSPYKMAEARASMEEGLGRRRSGSQENKENSNSGSESNNVIPFKQPTETPRLELPMPTPPSGEVTGLDSAIAYAEGLSDYCAQTKEQVGQQLPNGQEAVASCEQALANLGAGGVTGQALEDIASVQEQMTGAVAELQAALANLEAAGVAANSLAEELKSHTTVQEAYGATGNNAGNKEFVTNQS